MSPARTRILVGVIRDAARGRVLIARRPEHLAFGGMWEFPGGKQERGESREAALRRELREELDLKVESAEPMFRVDHDYPGRRVTLDVWEVSRWSGGVHGREGQRIEWLPIERLREREFPAANVAIIRWLSLPALYLLTPDLQEYGPEFLERLDRLLAAGVRLVQFRSTHLQGRARRGVLERVVALCGAHGARVLVNGAPQEALDTGAHGVHLNGARLAQLRARPFGNERLVAASVHDAAQLRRARRLDADFVVIGPVRPTASHPGQPAMGWRAFGLLAAGAGAPAYAIGGMRARDIASARRQGGRGVAMIRGIWDQRDPAGAVRAVSG